MKKKIIIGVIILLVIGLSVGSYFIFFKDDKDNKPTSNNKDEKITITFDSDGGTKVEDMKVKKGSSFQLPETTKEGYTFVGWYNGSTLYKDDDTASIKKNIVLTAKWEEKKDEDIYLNITFNSNGGTSIKDMKFKCIDGAATLNNLPTPKKDSYDFLSWIDKYGKAILNGALIKCEGKDPSMRLAAKWQKKEQSTLKVNFDYKDEDKTTTSKTYNCVNGAATLENLPRPTRDFYQFLSWEDKHGKSILDGASIICDGDLNLYAVWEYDGPTANPEQD